VRDLRVVCEVICIKEFIFHFLLCAAQKNAARVNCAAKKYEINVLIDKILLVSTCVQVDSRKDKID
jgi:hypothetical protein